VSTPENVEAFANLVKARERLAEITRKLTEAPMTFFPSGDERRRRERLQREWELAFEDFKEATAAFSATVHNMPADLKIDG
jgi:cytochrome c556